MARRMRRPRKGTGAAGVILQGFLERVSWRVLAEYSQILRVMIRQRPGVYALYKGDKLYYVGLASNLMGRVNTHLKNRHARKWDRFSVYLTSVGNLTRPLEALVLRIVTPSGNAVRGRIVGAENLYRALSRQMSAADADRRARLLGGQVARRRMRTRTSSGRGTLHLAGLVDRRLPLRANYKGRTYKATLRRDGYVSYRGKLYESPSAAGRAVTRHPNPGWSFWRYKQGRAGWVKLSELRR